MEVKVKAGKKDDARNRFSINQKKFTFFSSLCFISSVFRCVFTVKKKFSHHDISDSLWLFSGAQHIFFFSGEVRLFGSLGS